MYLLNIDLNYEMLEIAMKGSECDVFEIFLEYEMMNIHECEIATFDYAKNDECCYASEKVLRLL